VKKKKVRKTQQNKIQKETESDKEGERLREIIRMNSRAIEMEKRQE
jgi:hypothetical protein